MFSMNKQCINMIVILLLDMMLNNLLYFILVLLEKPHCYICKVY